MQRLGANRLQLLCLPYAGASATVFSRWRARVPSWLEVVPLELSGRGSRSAEAFARDLPELAAQLTMTVLAEFDAPYALFGHSMGAILAFELASNLSEAGRAPRCLFASGSAGPALRRTERFTALTSDQALLGELKRLGGTRSEVFESPELLALTLDILRADFAMCGRYRYQERAQLESPLHVLGGLRDDITLAELEAWRAHTRGSFTLDMLDGGHFFVHSQETRLLDLIAEHAEPWRVGTDDGLRMELSHG